MRLGMTTLVFVFLVGAAVCAASSVDLASSNSMIINLRSDLSQYSFQTIGGYDYIRSEPAIYLPERGVPGLPRETYHVAIPYGCSVSSIRAVCKSQLELGGTYRIVPTQAPTILGQSLAAWTDGRQDIYSADSPYPSQIIGGVHEGFMGSVRILSFYVSPFRWNPQTGRLMHCQEIEVTVELEPSHIDRPYGRHNAEREIFLETVRSLVVNPDDVLRFSNQERFLPLGAPSLEDAEYEYVVVTVDSLAACFEPLVEWKNQKGVPAKCVTREWIEANYTGEDIQSMIRNFLIDAYRTWGTVWVLLGADTDLIPSRKVFAMDAEMGPNGNRIRADLYYADLDGSWNHNGLAPYGEVADSIDMYPELFVGRAPAENAVEAEVFVDKVLLYEKNPPADYALKMLMPGEILWPDPLTDSGVGLDRIDEDLIPPRFDPILKLYESLGNETVESVLAAMSAGQNFVIHDGHCNEYVMGAGEGYIYYTDADTLSNYPRNFILNSIGCWPAAIDRDCIAEHFVNNPGGGCVAFIGNCRYGWGSPGNPGFGYSDVFQYEWARSVFGNEVLPLGQALAESKAVFVPFAGDSNVYRWNEYQVNLLGDPEMPVWTDNPSDLEVAAPPVVMAAGDVVRIVVQDAGGAVDGALVCLMNDDDVYLRDRTDQSGSVAFNVATSSPDSLLLTVTAPNHFHHQTKIPVTSQGVVFGWTELDVLDRGDAKVNPGEITDLGITIKNFGTEPDSGIWGILRSTDGLCTVIDSAVYYGQVGAGAQVESASKFSAEFDSSMTNGQAVVLELTLVDTSSSQWVCKVPLVIAAPVLSVASYGIDDGLWGDGDWIVEPGEEVLVTLEILNLGLTYGGANVHVVSLDPYYSAVDSVSNTGMVDPSCAGYTLHRVDVSSGCPSPHVGMLQVDVEVTDGPAFTDTVYFSVGDLTFSDNCESGEGSWTYSGLWHLSSYRSHSDSTSWYFGYDATHEYPSSATGQLLSEAFLAGEDNIFSFWFWHDFATYGVDGIYVVAYVNGEPDTLDFFGSGGALDDLGQGQLNIITDWVKWERLLPDVAPGDTVSFGFGFVSDNTDVAEGIYLDDISFSCRTPVPTGIDQPAVSVTAGLFQAFPNPAAVGTRLSFASKVGDAEICIYNVEGRLITRLKKQAGAGSVLWDLRDNSGCKVVPGIYLARAKAGGSSHTGKIVVLK